MERALIFEILCSLELFLMFETLPYPIKSTGQFYVAYSHIIKEVSQDILSHF